MLSSPRGFCAGVVRAIDAVELCLERFAPPVYVRHEIVHNRHVVDELRDKGAIFVDEISEIPTGSTVVFSAHGVPPSIWEEAKERDLQVIDATCPLVTKVHLEARKYAGEGYTIILVGHRGHVEVVGTMGHAADNTILIESPEEAASVEVPDDTKVVALTQTTLSVDDTAEVIEILKKRFPALITRNDICYATTNRQDAVKAIAEDVDIILVVGAENSSNSNRLRETAEAAGKQAYLINDPKDIQKDWLTGKKKIGITSGASTPEWLVQAVIDAIKPINIDVNKIAEENITFVLPKTLR
ncbi:MAG: 4-hydroxy-3-methylbut-2-enyl diphosphate reductase [Chloroflexi bacterium]|nr:MAG: 4-hydroxy-3-methylbut-2-enyl diphosphate reductase [Chloroflexota bacterium]